MRQILCALVVAALPAAAQSGAYFHSGSIELFSSSHQDIAWMDTPQACMLFRVNQCIRPAIGLMAKDRNYAFVMENMLNLAEFLDQRPQDRPLIERFTREGRLEWGATYNQPYEDLLSGEELIREAYFGRRWLKRVFPGTDAKVAFNPDVPGRTLQMPQILAKSGIPYLLVSRYHEGLYRWHSPDGSSVLMYSPGHYTSPKMLLSLPVAEAVPALERRLAERAPIYEKYAIPPVLPLLHSEDFSEPKDYGPLLEAWNKPGRPRLEYSSVRGFFERIDKPEAKFPELRGHRPNLWLYIGGPTHHWAVSALRDAARLLPAAETFATVRGLLDGNFQSYPAARLSEAWKAEIYPDHGWGGKNGHITDITFKEKAEYAKSAAYSVLGESLQQIASRIRVDRAQGTPVVVFNPLAATRTDPLVLYLPAGTTRLLDSAGQSTPCQPTGLENPDEVNVALGAHVTADSSASPVQAPDRAIDGKWSHLESERWVSTTSTASHWLVVDFDRPRTVHKIVLRHEGSLGKFQDIDDDNTTDFQLQAADSPAGPWHDIVAPVRGNKAVLTVHRFAPRTFRYLRVYITRAAARPAQPARLFEVEAFEAVPPRADKLVCMATAVPSVGYKTFYGTTGDAPKPASVASPTLLEDAHYRIRLAPGGVASLFDKQLGRELLETGKYLGGEVFTLQSVGNGAGEFTAVQQPTMEGFDKMSLHQAAWRVVETGPVRTVVELVSDWPDVTVRERIVLYHLVKRLDFDVALLGWNGTRYREFRIAWPLKGQVSYEVPMGVVEVGKSELQTTGGLAYGKVDYAGFIPEIRPREVRDFITVSNADAAVTLSSSVAAFDYQDPTTAPVPYPVIQPILLASRKSCHGEGNWYLQPGDHHYRFSLTSHTPGWQNGYLAALAANQPMFPAIEPGISEKQSLPPEQSFFSFSADSVVLSTIKKSEDDDTVTVRFYEMQGRDAKVAIRSFVPAGQAWRTNLIEEEARPANVESGSVVVDTGHHSIETVKFSPAKH
jgi:hypothetical protein